jgi:hypothetical protein
LVGHVAGGYDRARDNGGYRLSRAPHSKNVAVQDCQALLGLNLGKGGLSILWIVQKDKLRPDDFTRCQYVGLSA